MTSSTTDRLGGLSGSVAIKAPCKVATSGNIALSGLQTVDAPFSITVAEGDRVLVRLQTNQAQNGIWVASAGEWSRAVDFNGSKDIVNGTYVRVNQGTHAGLWYVNTVDPIVVSVTAIGFTKVFEGTSPSLGSLSGTSDNITQGTVNLFMTGAERTKLDGVAAGAEVNVNADWNAGSGDAQILNKPTLGTIASQNANSVTITGGTATLSTATVSGNFTFGGTTLTDTTGVDTKLVSGTAGTSGNVAMWNSDGDAVDSSVVAANILVDADIGVTIQAYDVDTAKTDVAQEYTRAQNFNATSLTDGVSIAWNVENNQVASVTLAGNRTLANPTNMKDGGTYILRVTQDGTGSRTLAYGSAYKWSGGTAPVLSTGAGKIDILTFISDGTNMYGVATLDLR